MLIAVFIAALIISLGYSYYRYVVMGGFLIDESQVESVEEAIDAVPEEKAPVDDMSTEEGTNADIDEAGGA